MSQPKPADLRTLDKVPGIIKELTGVQRTRCTIYNWIRNGRINSHGQRVKLSAYKRLGQLYTTQEAIVRFLRELG